CGLLVLGQAIRYPVGDDVVVPFIRRGDLDHFDATLAPLTLGLYPDARLVVVAHVQVLITRELTVALHQSETARIVLRKGGDQQALGIGKRPPQPLAVATVDGESVRIVYFGAVVICRTLLILAVEVHAGQRRDT